MITIALQFGNVDERSHGNKISPRALDIFLTDKCHQSFVDKMLTFLWHLKQWLLCYSKGTKFWHAR